MIGSMSFSYKTGVLRSSLTILIGSSPFLRLVLLSSAAPNTRATEQKTTTNTYRMMSFSAWSQSQPQSQESGSGPSRERERPVGAQAQNQNPATAVDCYLITLMFSFTSWLTAVLPLNMATARTVRLARLPIVASAGAFTTRVT